MNKQQTKEHKKSRERRSYQAPHVRDEKRLVQDALATDEF